MSKLDRHPSAGANGKKYLWLEPGLKNFCTLSFVYIFSLSEFSQDVQKAS